MRDNNPRRGPGDRRDRRFDSKREPRAAVPQRPGYQPCPDRGHG